jgi:hypothetical protein
MMISELKRILLSTLGITIAVILSVAALTLAIDIHCSNDSYYWMPIYPGAELLETSQQGYFRLRGMGVTQQTYLSADSPTEIRAWYREYNREITANVHNENPDAPAENFSWNNYTLALDEDGTGTIITYYSECAQ